MEKPRDRVGQWMKDGSRLLAQLIDEHDRANAASQEVQAECARLRRDLAVLNEENDRLVKEKSGLVETIAAALGTASDALRRLRDAPGAISPAALTTAGPVEAAIPARPGESVVVTPGVASTTIPVSGRPAPEDPGGPWRILVIDDDTNFTTLLSLHLADNRGYEVRSAASGEEGLTLLASYQPHVVLLDVTMPGIGGIATLRRIKELYPGLCVLMVTGVEDRAIAQEALALGARDYMKKPFDLHYLDAALEIYLTRDGAPLGAVPSAKAATDHDPGTPPGPSTGSPPRLVAFGR